MQKKLENLLKLLVFLTFISPWFVAIKSYIFPFIVPKILFFRSMALLMLGVYILLLVINWQRYKLRFSWINLSIFLFYFSFAISTFVGVDWYKSFWDNHERMLGLFTMTHYLIYYVVLTSVFKKWEDWKWFLRGFLIAGGVVMFVGVIQRFFNQDFLMNKGNRVFGTLGNAIYYSGYGLFLAFVGYLLAIKNKTRDFWFWFAVIGGLLGFFGIFLGGTRGVLLGLIAGVGLLILFYLASLKDNKKIKVGLGALVLAGAIILVGLFAFRQTDFVKSIPAVGRLVSTDISSNNTRIMAWKIAVEAWKEKPVFGWGPNNFYYAFNKYYQAEFLEHGWNETWFDNAHSVIMNTLAVQGAFGILSYLGIFAVVAIVVWRKNKKKEIDLHIAAVGFAFLLAHLVGLVTVFENPTSYLYFFFFLALINQQSEDEATKDESRGKIRSFSTGLTVCVFCFVFLLVYATNINPARANVTALQAIKSVQGMPTDGKTPIDLYNQALKYPSPHVDDIRTDFSRIASQMIPQIQDKELRLGLINLAYDELNKNLELHPLDIRSHLLLSQLAIQKASYENNSQMLNKAEKYLEEALAFSPERQQVIYQLAAAKARLNKAGEVVELLERALADDEKIGENWWRLIDVYNDLGEVERARELAQEATDKGLKFSGTGQQVINRALSGSVE